MAIARGFKRGALLLSLLASGMAAPALAVSYNFDVLYSGGNNAVLAAGSDDPLATVLLAGDDFTYSLTGTNGFYNTIGGGGDIFPFIALAVNESGTRTVDFTLSLRNMGAEVFNFSEMGVTNQQVHVGANSVILPEGLTFDQIFLTTSILDARTLDDTDSVTSTVNSLLPIFGSPENNQFYPGVVNYTMTATVPEPAGWAMMIGGVGLTATALRRSRRPRSVRFSAATA